jgi:predicted transposase/invertase (TIGR01784 family)
MARNAPNHHDALVKQGFANPKYAAEALRAILPKELVTALDFEHLKVETGSFVDKALEQSHSDLLFSVPVAGEPALIYVLFEHMSRRDRRLSLRLLRYVLRILERFNPTYRNSDSSSTTSATFPMMSFALER